MQVDCYRTGTTSRWSVEHRDAKTIVICRSDCPQPQPTAWCRQLAQLLETMPGVVAVSAKRFDHEGCVFFMGEFVIHPKGFFHLGCGVDGDAYRFPQEVGAICGGVMVENHSAFDQVAGDHPLDGPLATLQLCLALRVGAS